MGHKPRSAQSPYTRGSPSLRPGRNLGLGRKAACCGAPPGPVLARSAGRGFLAVGLNPTAALHFRRNESPRPADSPGNPSTVHYIPSFFLSGRRRCRWRPALGKTNAPPWAPSPARALPHGRACRRRGASRWCSERCNRARMASREWWRKTEPARGFWRPQRAAARSVRVRRRPGSCSLDGARCAHRPEALVSPPSLFLARVRVRVTGFLVRSEIILNFCHLLRHSERRSEGKQPLEPDLELDRRLILLLYSITVGF